MVYVQALLFRRRHHHCLCVLQLNDVQACVHVLGGRFHCESSALTFVYTSVLKSQVKHRNAEGEGGSEGGVRASPLLITTNFVIYNPDFLSVAGLAQMRGSST